MRVHFSLLLLLAAITVPEVSAFTPITVPEVGTNSEEKWWRVKNGDRTAAASGTTVGNANGNKRRRDIEIPSMKIRRMEYPDDGTHPEIRQVQAANAATYKYRRRGIPGPEVDGAQAIRDVEASLRRRGIPAVIEKRQTSSGGQVVTIGAGQTASATNGIIPAATPRAPNSMGVAQDGRDLSYFSEVKFGSNGKSFVLVIDTGSADTWIPSDTCKSRACQAHATYSSKDSKTLSVGTRAFSIRYGSGEVEGTLVADSVSFAGFNMNISFGVATKVSDDFVYFPIDGIMGLGFQNASQQNVPTILDELVNNRFIDEKLFAIALARHTDAVNDGVVNFGAIDADLFEGQLNFIPSVSQHGLWEIKVDDISIDGRGAGLSGRTAVIDSGTSLVLLPPADALKLHAIIPGAETNGDTFAVPCDTTSNIEFTFGGVKYKVPPQDYVSDKINAEKNICQSLVAGRQILGKNMWLLGDVFLKNVYSVFDLDNGRVGLAPRKKAQDSPPNSKPSSTPSSPARTSAASSPTARAGTPTPSESTNPDGSRIGNAAPFDTPGSTATRASAAAMGVSCLVALLAVVGL
ncbi:acid protease [Choiromyces venosus 120613-1]|uniref:Acid protease n=1 Tax=Choiromyces venosus 120613-1 TaxID=1336337 RepID=A0A3N4K0W6_9PEZI|nr:acid protease [Choiromyces venosus 120613-1]